MPPGVQPGQPFHVQLPAAAPTATATAAPAGGAPPGYGQPQQQQMMGMPQQQMMQQPQYGGMTQQQQMMGMPQQQMMGKHGKMKKMKGKKMKGMKVCLPGPSCLAHAALTCTVTRALDPLPRGSVSYTHLRAHET